MCVSLQGILLQQLVFVWLCKKVYSSFAKLTCMIVVSAGVARSAGKDRDFDVPYDVIGITPHDVCGSVP